MVEMGTLSSSSGSQPTQTRFVDLQVVPMPRLAEAPLETSRRRVAAVAAVAKRAAGRMTFDFMVVMVVVVVVL